MKKGMKVVYILCLSMLFYACTNDKINNLPDIYQFIVFEKELPGWEQSFGERAFAIVEGETFFDIINGGATEYINHGYKKALRQELNDTSGRNLILMVVEFENNAAAEKMFIDTKEEGTEYVKLTGYSFEQARGYLFADGILVTALYKNMYIVIQLVGYSDENTSIQDGIKILELLFKKGENS